jgi:hypothetical protein
MKAFWIALWNNRTMCMSVLQIMTANLVSANLIPGGFWTNVVLYVNGTLTGLIALHNKIKEIRAERASTQEPQ